mmetsp:Transcript_10313/g.27489  ORF Transcript_10313/g.27489 Transcript_10313/m.27489 type:complete len:235 (-) Transcript_10313:478-1182(-)
MSSDARSPRTMLVHILAARRGTLRTPPRFSREKRSAASSSTQVTTYPTAAIRARLADSEPLSSAPCTRHACDRPGKARDGTSNSPVFHSCETCSSLSSARVPSGAAGNASSFNSWSTSKVSKGERFPKTRSSGAWSSSSIAGSRGCKPGSIVNSSLLAATVIDCCTFRNCSAHAASSWPGSRYSEELVCSMCASGEEKKFKVSNDSNLGKCCHNIDEYLTRDSSCVPSSRRRSR